MTAWRRALDGYLALRRSVGFKLETAGRVLPSFVTYLERRHASTITSDLALAWAMQPHGKRDLWAVRLGLVRGFARYQQAFDPGTEVPPPELLPQRRRRATPFLFSNGEVRSLVRAARQPSTGLERNTSACGPSAAMARRPETIDWYGLRATYRSSNTIA